MKTSELLQAWSRILTGRAPSLSIEITKECPLRCPGCYAFDDDHLGTGTSIRSLADYKGEELIQRVLALVDEKKPVHLSIVGGDPLVRYRELDSLLPQLGARGIHVQLVTSAFRVIPKEWMEIPGLYVVVSIDGLQPEHDARRKPATYERILKSIADARVTIHSTITAQIAGRPGYLEKFLRFWSAQPQIQRVWFSLFTPQRGATDPEILSPAQRAEVAVELKRLRRLFPILEMGDQLIDEIHTPPSSPDQCIFARTTETISADLKTRITPCQFGGDPDCSQCGCIASMGLAAVGHHGLVSSLTVGDLFLASDRVGQAWKRVQEWFQPAPTNQPELSPFKIL
ncbi:radical SAM protein [Silvibacterium dinghuense]|uniref:Radical SAM protein n=1 Tax=Silvibacterium dinghuense TaxID=1560006 RepID=A0A4Q1SDR9_9BACT|nr:radical SAM protein [Silvibacterium dinghuense]RXS95386.1 radical SAM protein [Silvibacterium dinghuense]GGH12850.1 hypothetical protein GCM10011586_32360 [Silvibacterium dinghuense]